MAYEGDIDFKKNFLSIFLYTHQSADPYGRTTECFKYFQNVKGRKDWD
jgi:hypothetical protein